MCSSLLAFLFVVSVLLTPLPPRPTLFPYTTLFRSPSEMLSMLRPKLLAFLAALPLAAVPMSFAVRAPAARSPRPAGRSTRSEEHTSELQSRRDLVCRLLLEKKKKIRHIVLLID